MEFTKEQIEEIGLSEEQLTKVVTLVNENEQVLNQTFGKKVNENAENIIDSIVKPVEDLTGIKRERGEKAKDFLTNAGEGYVLGLKAELEQKKTELEEKLKNNSGDETLKQQLEENKTLIDGLKKKEAIYDEWEKNDYKGKYEQASDKLTTMERSIAFKSVIPARPESINKYEWKERLREWESEVEVENNIVLDENDTPWAVDKNNEFKKVKLEDLLKQNKDINELLAGHTPIGLGAKPATEEYEGVPFKISKDATPNERAKLIKEYLTVTEGLNQIDDNYAKRYTEINNAILGKNPAKKN